MADDTVLDPYNLPPPSATNLTVADVQNIIRSQLANNPGMLRIGQGDDVFKVDEQGIYLGAGTFGDAAFSVNMQGVLTATGAVISGAITAVSGAIGGWTIAAAELSSGNVHLKSTAEQILVGSATAPLTGAGIFIGKDGSDYEFRIGDPAGKYMHYDGSNLTIVSATASALVLSSLAAGSELAVQEWQFDGAVTVTDYNTVAWASGTLRFADGTTYSISGGNTGNMAALTYIYFDKAVSTTAFQVTTTPATAVGAGKVLIGVAQDNADTAKDATFQIFGGSGGIGQTVTAAKIVAGTITGNEIAASTITAGKLSVSTLSAITADMGSITAGTIVLSSSGHVRSGQTDYDSGTGFFLGISGGVSKFSIGNSAGAKLTWDGTDLNISGGIAAVSSFTAAQAIYQGNAVALGTNGQISRTRATDIVSTGPGADLGSTDTGVISTFQHVMLDISSTVKLMVYVADNGSGTDIPRVCRIICDPASGTITSATHTTITSASASACTSIDAVLIDANTVAITYCRGGTMYCKILSGLDSGVTQNTELNAGSSATCAIADVSATEFILFYYVAATEVRSQKVTVSGTTCSSSTTSTIYSTSATQAVHRARRYGSTSAYFVCFSESTTTFRGIVGTYSAGTFSMGSAVTIESFNVYEAHAESIDDTNVIICYTRASNRATSARVESRSGTTLTSNSALSLGSGAASGYTSGFCKVGKYSYVSCVTTAATTNTFKLLDVTGTTITQLGSDRTHTTSSGRYCEVVPLGPTRFIGHDCRASTTRNTFTYDFTTNHALFLGIAQADIAAAASGNVITHGVSDDVSGLTTGSLYYTDIDGALTTKTTGSRVGFASAATKIIVRT